MGRALNLQDPSPRLAAPIRMALGHWAVQCSIPLGPVGLANHSPYGLHWDAGQGRVQSFHTASKDSIPECGAEILHLAS